MVQQQRFMWLQQVATRWQCGPQSYPCNCAQNRLSAAVTYIMTKPTSHLTWFPLHHFIHLRMKLSEFNLLLPSRSMNLLHTDKGKHISSQGGELNCPLLVIEWLSPCCILLNTGSPWWAWTCWCQWCQGCQRWPWPSWRTWSAWCQSKNFFYLKLICMQSSGRNSLHYLKCLWPYLTICCLENICLLFWC